MPKIDDPGMQLACVEPDWQSLCREVLLENMVLCRLYWAKKTALSPLVGKVMQKCKGRANPQRVSHELQIRLDSWPQIRTVEDELWGVWDWGTETWLSTHGDVADAERAWEQVLKERGFLTQNHQSLHE